MRKSGKIYESRFRNSTGFVCVITAFNNFFQTEKKNY